MTASRSSVPALRPDPEYRKAFALHRKGPGSNYPVVAETMPRYEFSVQPQGDKQPKEPQANDGRDVGWDARATGAMTYCHDDLLFA